MEFREVPTPELLVLEEVPSAGEEPAVKGRFVKVAPVLPASARESFDGPGVAARLRAAGARAVVLAPVFVPDSRRREAEAVRKAPSAREAVEAWFELQTSIPEEVRGAAAGLLLRFMDEEGL